MKRDSRAPLIVAIVLLLLPVLYLGSYLAIVVPGPSPFDDDYRSFAVSLTPNVPPGNYRFASPFLSKVYWPLEQIDRKVRPVAWEATGIGFEYFEGPVSP